MPEGNFRKLNGTNYAEWSIMMEAWLVKKGVWGVVSGDLVRPTGSPNSKPVKAFVRQQSEARAEIILHVEESQLAYVRERDPNGIWKTLVTIYRARGFATRRALRRRFFGLTKQEDQPMAAWVAEVRSAAFRLEEIDVEVPEDDIIMVLTGGLPPLYDNFVTTLDSTPPDDFTLEYVIGRVLNEESRHTPLTQCDLTSNALVAAAARKKTPIELITCFKCQKRGHYQSACPENTTTIDAAGVIYTDGQYMF
jgi:hypothetical protein